MNVRYYAVKKGRKTGVFSTWNECREQVHGFKGAQYKAFDIENAAYDFAYGNNTAQTFFMAIPSMGKKRTFSQVDEDTKKGEETHLETPAKKLKKSEQQNSIINIYTDGSCLANGRKNAAAGIGVFFGDNDPRNISERFKMGKPSNQRAELYAVVRALQVVDDAQDVKILTDSQYVVQSMTSWISKWIKTNFKDVKNVDLIKALATKIEARSGNVYFEYIAAHKGLYGNTQADALAQAGSRKQ